MKIDRKYFVTKTAIALWRLGNTTTPRMSHLRLPPRPPGRQPDLIPVPEVVNGEVVLFVLPNSGGISLYDAIHPGLNGEAWYELPVGTQIPPGLAIREDHKDPLFDVVHFTITPCHKMTLKAFADLLDPFGKTAQPRFDRKASKI